MRFLIEILTALATGAKLMDQKEPFVRASSSQEAGPEGIRKKIQGQKI